MHFPNGNNNNYPSLNERGNSDLPSRLNVYKFNNNDNLLQNKNFSDNRDNDNNFQSYKNNNSNNNNSESENNKNNDNKISQKNNNTLSQENIVQLKLYINIIII